MAIVIINPFAGLAVKWTYAQHLAGGYSGGTDYGMSAGRTIKAAADGTVFRTSASLNGVGIRLADGRSIVYLENKSVLRSSGKIKRGDPIAVSGRYDAASHQTKWPHIHGLTASGARVPFEPMVTGSSTAGGGETPIPIPKPTPTPTPTPAPEEEEEEDEMKTTGIYYTRKADNIVVYALINPGSGFYSEWSVVPASYNNAIAAAFDTGSFVGITEGHAANLKASAAQVRTGN